MPWCDLRRLRPELRALDLDGEMPLHRSSGRAAEAVGTLPLR